MKHLFACFVAVASLANAQDAPPPLKCGGTEPHWNLDLFGNTAQFRFSDKTVDFDIPQQSVSENRLDTHVYTLLAAQDTAIVLVERETCQTVAEPFPFEVQILTQRRGLPILLSGCCVPIK